MVCKKCEKTLKKVAPPDPFRNRNAAGFLVSSGTGATTSRTAVAGAASGGRRLRENKQLTAGRFSPLVSRCKLCSQSVLQERANYCQKCAYKKGLCAICGTQILDTSRYKQSS
ncbi:hypothetical protein MCUN1_001471 [Malassezia cuniculi]|uniref:Cysteine-rich PDZ-binding protein n=1 Tax=Malassezia cuniculi TaxID=948313 RepID=A0AAF0EQR2_9BASI|nr:hypothetical protein MCUN1_001471 [Malassezia cuniculi]